MYIRTILIWMMLISYSCSQGTNHQVEGHKFYDFDFCVELYEEPHGILKKITYDGLKDNDSLILYEYFDRNANKLLTPKITKSAITKDHLSWIYRNILVKNLTPNYIENKSDKVPPPIPNSSNEWGYTVIKLNLKYWGDIHTVTLDYNEDLFQQILNLSSYKKTSGDKTAVRGSQ